MKVATEEFRGKVLRYSIVSEDGILFNTLDVCRILRILKRPAGSILSESCLNMAGIIEASLTDGRSNMSFINWVEMKFIGYDIHTPIGSDCDDDWQVKPSARSN